MRDMKKNLMGIIIFICALFIPSIVHADDVSEKLHFISTTDGDSIIVESNGHFGLIDALDQTSVSDVKTYAQALMGSKKFDFVIMTHNHADNIGGIPELADYFDADTIVFYKEDLVSYDSNEQIDDYEELQGLQNHSYYQAALQTFNSINSKTCDVTKASLITNSSCSLSSLSNSFISSVTYSDNSEAGVGSNVAEYLNFDFGDFNIKLYSLYSLAYHHENLNSIVTLVTNKETDVKALLTSDVEVTRSDADYPENTGRSNINSNPTFTPDPEDPSYVCEECTLLGIENQLALAIGPVDLLQAANNGKNGSNSLYSIETYAPAYYITDNSLTGSDYIANVAAIIYLKATNSTKVYSPIQATTALVAIFSDDSEDITIKNYNNSAVATSTALTDLSTGPFENGWKILNNSYIDDLVKFYVDNGQPVINSWKDIDGYTYHFSESGIMDTGLYVEENDEDDENDDETYYLCEDDSCLGQMQVGLQILSFLDDEGSLINYKFYFRTVQNEISTGKRGEMVTGLVEINDGVNDGTYYFRSEDDEVYLGPKGSALTNGCVTVGSQTKCFDDDGKLTTNIISVNKPTNALCASSQYIGTSQIITKTPIGGYTFSNNEQTNADTYQVKAELNDTEHYKWEDNTTDPVFIECSISKKSIMKPEIIDETYLYIGSPISPSFNGEDGIFQANESIDDITVTGTISATAVGHYSVNFDLNDKNNTEWDDGTADAFDVDWNIAGAAQPTPTVNPYVGIYDGSEKTVTVLGEGTPEYSSNGEDWSDTPITRAVVGVTVVYVRIKGNANYVASDPVESSITIIKRGITEPSLNSSSIQYTGSEIDITSQLSSEYDSSLMNISGTTSATNVGDYSITIELIDFDNNQWLNSSTSAITLTWNITKAPKDPPTVDSYSRQYDGQEHTVTVTSSEPVEYSETGLDDTWTNTAPTLTEVGTKQVFIRNKGDNNHYPSSYVEHIIEITPKKLTKPSLNQSSFTYSGSVNEPEITGYDSSLMNISGTTSATDAGQYTIDIDLKDTDNYSWADDTTGSVSLVWEVIKDQYPAPTLSDYSGIYDGQEHTILVTNNTTGVLQYKIDNGGWGSVLPSRIDAGTSTVYVQVLGDDNHEASNVVSKTITITKANVADPVVTSYTGDYDGQPHTITVGTVSTGTLKYSTNGSSWTTTKPTRTDAGTTTVYVQVFGDNNHNNSDTKIGTITIKDSITYEIKKYPVDETNKYINKIIVGTDLETFKANITLGSGYSVLVDTKTVNGKKVLYTGGKTKIMKGTTVVKEYTNIVIGDTNGDGKTDSADLLRIRQHLLGIKPLTGIYFTAADVNYDGKVDSADLLKIRQHLLGIKLIK